MGLYKVKNTWYMEYKEPAGRWVRESTKCKLKTQAQDMLRRREAEVHTGEFWSATARKIKFNAAADKYLEYEKNTRKKPKSIKCDESKLKSLRPYFGEMALSKITPRDILDYIEKRKTATRGPEARRTTIKGATINRDLALLKHIFSVSRKVLGFEGKNPVCGIDFFPEHERKYILKDEEIERLIQAAPPLGKKMIVIALNTAMRAGEILGLKWGLIDFETHFITLPAVNTKNGKERLVPMNPIVERELQELRGESEFVFPNPHSRSSHVDSIKRWFTTARKKAGLPDFHFHDLRHCAGTALAQLTDGFTLREIMGHADYRTTQRYINAARETKLAAVNALAMAVERSAAKTKFACPNPVIREDDSRANLLISN